VKKSSKGGKGAGGSRHRKGTPDGRKARRVGGEGAGEGGEEEAAAKTGMAESVHEDDEEEYVGEDEENTSSSSDSDAPAAKRVRNGKGKKVSAPPHKPAVKNGLNATSGYKGVTR
jgi:hypothetical protein